VGAAPLVYFSKRRRRQSCYLLCYWITFWCSPYLLTSTNYTYLNLRSWNNIHSPVAANKHAALLSANISLLLKL